MTFICERDSYSLEMCENELPMSRLSNRPTDIQTDRQVTRGHFRSRERDKDGGRTIRTIRSAVVENPMTRKPDDFIFYRTGVMDNRSLHCGNRHFGRIHYSAPVTLTLTQLPSYTNLTRIAWRYTLDVQI